MSRYNMANSAHHFTEYVLNPIPDSLWRQATPIEDTRLGFCDTCGFYHVDPYPDAAYLAKFYSCYEMPTTQANLAETARLLTRNLDKSATVVDMGCGDGGFLQEMHALGFANLIGFDQSPGLERAQRLGFGRFFKASVWDYLAEAEKHGGIEADALVMVNVLEHITEPLEFLLRIRRLMPENGKLCITVPNDFSPLQRAFLKVKRILPWFVCVPDHLNYFDFNTLGSALRKTGFRVVDQSGLYPLELFLLQDLDYISNPELGPIAHQRRVTFENNLKEAGMVDVLDHFYGTLAAGGFGRDVMVVASLEHAQSF
ncbi:class I SAM-dependent methyltransferase [Candidatus Kaiserbacteria bacterium]|nr:class I SAM-dependent methyltransferase [Candidatus Kaiserbacteria bacterium]